MALAGLRVEGNANTGFQLRAVDAVLPAAADDKYLETLASTAALLKDYLESDGNEALKSLRKGLQGVHQEGTEEGLGIAENFEKPTTVLKGAVSGTIDQAHRLDNSGRDYNTSPGYDGVLKTQHFNDGNFKVTLPGVPGYSPETSGLLRQIYEKVLEIGNVPNSNPGYSEAISKIFPGIEKMGINHETVAACVLALNTKPSGDGYELMNKGQLDLNNAGWSAEKLLIAQQIYNDTFPNKDTGFSKEAKSSGLTNEEFRIAVESVRAMTP